MIDHDRALELAAAALDFPLSDDDREALRLHLDGCAGCRAVDERLRADARAIAGLATQDAPVDLRARILAATAAPRRGPAGRADHVARGDAACRADAPTPVPPARCRAGRGGRRRRPHRRHHVLPRCPERWPGRGRGEPIALGPVAIGFWIADDARPAGHPGRDG